MSVRLRLTLWYAGVLLVILSLLGGGIHTLMAGKLRSMVRTRLDADYKTIETIVSKSGGDLYDVAHLGDAALFQLTRGEQPAYATRAWEALGLSQALDTGSMEPYGAWSSSAGRDYLLRAGPVDHGFRLALALDSTAVAASIRSLRVILLAALPCALVLAVAGGWFLAGRALAPVNAITAKAREISAERLSERLPVVRPDDEIGRLARVFNDTLARLESSFEQLRRFTADASHELRTPLSSLRSVGEVALGGKPDAEAYGEAIASMLEETDRLTRLTDNLLTLARGDCVRLERRSLDLRGLAADIVEEMRVLAEEKHQTLSLSGGPPVPVTADAASLRQAIGNVLHNAIRYTQARGHVELRVSTTPAGQAVLDVCDDGPGIAPAERARVFERFYRVDEARSRADGGAGLGLAIARWAVEANGGSIELLDGRGSGICCRMSLATP